MTAVAATRREAGGRPFPLSFARGAPLLGLAAFGVLHWMTLVEPAVPGRGWVAVLAAFGVVCALCGAARLGITRARVLAGAAGVAAAGSGLLAAGVPAELLRPDHWGALAGGIGRGVESIAGARVPYRGLDEWTRIVIVLGGTLLPSAAALAAFWPRRGGRVGFPGAALVLLVTLYVTPAVALDFPGDFARGAVLTVLVLAFLRLDRVRLYDAPGAAMAVVAVAAVALVAAPILDRDQPWWDYETWALSAAESKSTTFMWEHDYGPLDWPRDGREVLRVKARQAAYWKAENLDHFDGARWRQGQPVGMREAGAYFQLPEDLEANDPWIQTINVSVRNMRTRTFVTAGTAFKVDTKPRRMTLPMGAGIFTTTRTLRRGDAYSARVYTPRPSSRRLAAAGTDYEPWLQWYHATFLPDRRTARPGPGDRAVLAMIPRFDEDEEPIARVAYRQAPVPGRELIEKSSIKRTWELARKLRAASSTPYAFVKRVERHLQNGYAYTETPDPRAETLDGFLFDAKEGYCQQFSGAMALLVRLGGVPARVATGFTSGRYDEDAKEYVVRDMDAHSWVEVWFPGHGWVPFDPTPSDAPPRSQANSDGSPTPAVGDIADLGSGSPLDPRAAQTADEGGGPSRLGIALALLAAVGAVAVLVARRKPALRGIAELERALRRAGAQPAPDATLVAIERHFSGYPAAAAYVRAVRESRYAGRGSELPTKSQRRALREALSGDGVIGRLRGWWALPPRVR